MERRLDARASDSKTSKPRTTGWEGPQPPTPPTSAAKAQIQRDSRSLAFRSKPSIVQVGKLRPGERQANHLARQRQGELGKAAGICLPPPTPAFSLRWCSHPTDPLTVFPRWLGRNATTMAPRWGQGLSRLGALCPLPPCGYIAMCQIFLNTCCVLAHSPSADSGLDPLGDKVEPPPPLTSPAKTGLGYACTPSVMGSSLEAPSSPRGECFSLN